MALTGHGPQRYSPVEHDTFCQYTSLDRYAGKKTMNMWNQQEPAVTASTVYGDEGYLTISELFNSTFQGV